MKKNIHPNYNKQSRVTCSCGMTFIIGSVRDDIRVDVCSNCHPFYTGEKRYIDTLGQVGKFERKQKIASVHKETLSGKNKKLKKKSEYQAKSLRELLMES